VLLARVLFQHAEASRKGDLLRGAEPLVAEHDHLVLEERCRELRKRGVIERLRQVEACDFHAQVPADAVDMHARQ
jgi:hypothetical protein